MHALEKYPSEHFQHLRVPFRAPVSLGGPHSPSKAALTQQSHPKATTTGTFGTSWKEPASLSHFAHVFHKPKASIFPMLLTSFFSFFLLAYSLALSSHRNDFMTFIRCFHHKTRIIGLLCFLPMCSLTPETAPVCFFPSL